MAQSPDISSWIGSSQERHAVIDINHANLMAVTLDGPKLADRDALPHLWHWGWFNDALPSSELGRDGHPKKGGFLPPIDLPRRMWAGGSLEFKSPIIIGREITKRSTIESISQKDGKSGKLCIVTIRHELLDGSEVCISEKQNLVYREDPKPTSAPPSTIAPPVDAMITNTVIPDPVLMFRYSALTFNGHRIHYDVDYARSVEGYPDLVFHAPLTATKLCGIAQELAGEHSLKRFEYRATAPLFGNQPFSIKAIKNNNEINAWAETPAGGLAMQAKGEM